MAAKINQRVAWGYVVELALAMCIYAICFLTFGADALSAYIGKTADEWNDLTAGLFSAAVAIWLTFVNIQATEFGDYLRFKGKDDSYTFSFISPMVSFFVTTASLISSKGAPSVAFSNVAFFLLVYSGTILITLVRTATQMVRAYGDFKIVKKTEDEQQKCLAGREEQGGDTA